MAGDRERAAAQSPSDFDLLVDLYPRLRRFAAVLADLDVDPDDLVQDALCATLRRHTLSEIEDPAAYLKRAMLNAVASDRRRKGVWKKLLPRLAADSHTSDRYPSDLAELDALGPLDRAVLFMVDVEGLPHGVVAIELGLTHSAIRKRASRARARLRPNLTMISKEGRR